jgi:hypothetical protein
MNPVFELVKYSLADRSSTSQPNGLSCDDDGLFIAGRIPIAPRVRNPDGSLSYQLRNLDEINLVLSAAYGIEIDVAGKANHLGLVTRYMKEGKWVLAKIVAVQLGFPDLPSEAAIRRAFTADRLVKSGRHTPLTKCSECRSDSRRTAARKRDVSNEPRVPAGQSGGGEWESGDAGGIGAKPTSNPLLIPAQALAPPITGPIELPIPVPPTEITPFPPAITAPNVDPLNPTANPYPDRPECVEEWAHATEFCLDQMKKGKLKPGYPGFGKNFQKCVLGEVSQECGGNPTA